MKTLDDLRKQGPGSGLVFQHFDNAKPRRCACRQASRGGREGVDGALCTRLIILQCARGSFLPEMSYGYSVQPVSESDHGFAVIDHNPDGKVLPHGILQLAQPLEVIAGHR